VNADGSVNDVIEIPAGTNAKWEVAKTGDAIEWEMQDGKPRVVSYLAYPGNYGMVPGTRLTRQAGGDGDPLDVLVLGAAAARGSVQPVRIVALLKLLDDGERDDKLIAVPLAGPLSDVRDLEDLLARYPGITAIIETWFLHYKGPGRIESGGWADASTGLQVLDETVDAFGAWRHPTQVERRGRGSYVPGAGM
jgi:inorganic pyrophosphatase